MRERQASPLERPPSHRSGAGERDGAGHGLSASGALAAVFGLLDDSWVGPRPYCEVCSHLTADKLIRVGEQRVHVEQAGDGDPVVLLHGFGCSSHSWRRIIPALAAGHRVIAPDLNGFGWTERPKDAAAYTFEGQEALVLGVLAKLGVDRFHLVGHSYGGGLSLFIASRHRQRVRSLALLGTVLPDYGVTQRQAWARFRSLNWLLVHFFVLSRNAIRKALELSYHDKSLVDDALIDAYRSRLLVEGVEDAYYGLMAPLDLPAPDVDLAELDVPSLVLWGDHDALIPFEIAEPQLARLPQAQLELLDGCGHSPMEEQPEAVLQHLLPFLHRHRPRWQERVLRMARRAACRIAWLGGT